MNETKRISIRYNKICVSYVQCAMCKVNTDTTPTDHKDDFIDLLVVWYHELIYIIIKIIITINGHKCQYHQSNNHAAIKTTATTAKTK